jgi:hypothetical protein
MIKKYFPFFIFTLFPLFLCGCMNTDTIKLQFNTSESELLNRVKQMVIQDNFTLESEKQFSFSTQWKKSTKEENNIPDNTIEGKLEVVIYHTANGTEILVTVKKRSSLDSTNPDIPSYLDVGIMMNDLLYTRWNDKLKLLQEEYKKK